MVSAAKVLVTTLYIFLQPQDIGLTGQVTLFPISLWVAIVRVPVGELAIIRVPVWELGLVFEASDASENAGNLRPLMGIDWILMVTS